MSDHSMHRYLVAKTAADHTIAALIAERETLEDYRRRQQTDRDIDFVFVEERVSTELVSAGAFAEDWLIPNVSVVGTGSPTDMAFSRLHTAACGQVFLWLWSEYAIAPPWWWLREFRPALEDEPAC
jgi:hypothetical protein